MPFVFVSYPQKHRDEVEALVSKLEDKGIEVYWDKLLEPGLWEQQLHQKLADAAAMIVVINEEVVRRGASSYVLKEVKIAVDQGYEMILPIKLGDINLDGDIAPLVQPFQTVSAKDMLQLLTKAEFQTYIEKIKRYIDAGGRGGWSNRIEAKDADAVGWPVTGDDLLDRQALALGVAVFEGELPFLVSDAAEGIKGRLETVVRRETREEREARPRAFVNRSFSDQLGSVGARRLRVAAGYHEHQDVVQFIDSNQRQRLIEYIWREQPEVRKILVQWITDLVGRDLSDDLNRRISGGLAHIAQVDLHGLLYEVMSVWLSLDPATLNKNPEARRRKLKELEMASALFASAYNIRANRPLINKTLNDLAGGATLLNGGRSWAWQTAVVVALGPLGQRAPKLAVELLKKIGPHIRVGRFWNDGLRDDILASPLVRGERNRDVKDLASYEDAVAEADQGATPVGGDDALPEPAPLDPADVIDDGDGPSLSEGDGDTAARGRSLPSAEFLGELAQWIDVKVARGPDAKKKLYQRQTAIWLFCAIFERMPVYRKEGVTRLTLQDLVGEIAKHEPDLFDDIVTAFTRAARAERQQTSTYLAYLHLQIVFRNLANIRKQSPNRIDDVSCPYLQFARRVFAAVHDVEPGRSHFVTRGSGRFLSTDEIDFIEGAIDALPARERT